MTLYGGIDLHANNSLMALLDDHDKIVFEKQVPNEITTIFAHFVPYHAHLVGLVAESTSNWYGLVDGLLVAGSDAAVHAKPMGRLSCPGGDHGSSLDLDMV
jgi:transposase